MKKQTLLPIGAIILIFAIVTSCTNKYAILKLNGKIVNMATDLSVGEGILGLQAETAEIFYRNIMIKELDKDIPMEVFLK